MGKIWDILQVIFGLLLVWVFLDMALDMLWINGYFGTTLGIDALAPFALVAYLIAILAILQLVKTLLRDD